MGIVVGHQPPARADQTQGQIALARARRAGDQDTAPARGRGPARRDGAVQRGVPHPRRPAPANGRATSKRAPCVSPAPSARFSARIVPPWASMI